MLLLSCSDSSCGSPLYFRICICATCPRVCWLSCSAILTCQDALLRGDDEDGDSFTLSVRASDLAAMRASSSEITEGGARLYELLKREGENREARATALRFLDAVSSSLDSRAEHEYLEHSIHDAVANVKVRPRLGSARSSKVVIRMCCRAVGLEKLKTRISMHIAFAFIGGLCRTVLGRWSGK